MRVLIVKLSSLGDVVHAMPAVQDLRRARPGVLIDWVVEPAFAPLLQRVEGLNAIIHCPLRRWRKAWWTAAVRADWRAFKARLQQESYDAVIDLQGLTKSALVARLARGRRHGLANRTEGSAHEAPARWLVDEAHLVPFHLHALDRSRVLMGHVLGVPVQGSPRFGLKAIRSDEALDAGAAAGQAPLMVLVHGTSRDDKLWPEAHWVSFGLQLVRQGWRIALPRAGELESARAERIAAAIGPLCQVWPAMGLDALVDQLGTAQGVVGVDSGLSHIAVALDLPHVQIYNFATAWRTGPQAAHGHRHQVSVEPAPGQTTPALEAVAGAWAEVWAASGLSQDAVR
jgi:heptosyltransferase I